jgi:hypothetical protein
MAYAAARSRWKPTLTLYRHKSKIGSFEFSSSSFQVFCFDSAWLLANGWIDLESIEAITDLDGQQPAEMRLQKGLSLTQKIAFGLKTRLHVSIFGPRQDSIRFLPCFS